jgi:SAM-dependent methyltransferase
MGDCTNKTVLEIGAGTGEVSHWIAEATPATVLATDLCVPFMEGARKRFVLPNLRYEVLDFNKAEQFSDQKFDFVIGTGILHHLYHNLDYTCKRMFELLKDGGKIIFLEPNLYNPYVYFVFSYDYLRESVKLEPDEMAFSNRFIEKKLKHAGYSDVRVEFRDFVLPGLPKSWVHPMAKISDVLEKIPLIKCVSQSLFITAVKK